ncbi:MAG: hypothetical protein ACD_5C00334G0001, partial [uncultured bacterium]
MIASGYAGKFLYQLFSLSEEQFATEQRNEFWLLVKTSLSELSKWKLPPIGDLIDWFRLSMQQVNASVREDLFGNLLASIEWFTKERGYNTSHFLSFLPDFFQLSQDQFTITQRSELLEATRKLLHQCGDHEDFYDCLNKLYSLPQTQLTQEQRLFIVKIFEEAGRDDLAAKARHALRSQMPRLTLFAHTPGETSTDKDGPA